MRVVLPVFVPGLLIVALGCSGVFSQSFNDAFMPTCLDTHAPNVPDLANAEEACACAKRSVERETEDPLERLTMLAEEDTMQKLLVDCNTDAGADRDDPAADDARFDDMGDDMGEGAEDADADADE